jgi:hypothetical protein
MNTVPLSSREPSEGRAGEISYERLTGALGSRSCVLVDVREPLERPATRRVRSTGRSPLLIRPNCHRTSLSFSCAKRAGDRPRRWQKPLPRDEPMWFTIPAA